MLGVTVTSYVLARGQSRKRRSSLTPAAQGSKWIRPSTRWARRDQRSRRMTPEDVEITDATGFRSVVDNRKKLRVEFRWGGRRESGTVEVDYDGLGRPPAESTIWSSIDEFFRQRSRVNSESAYINNLKGRRRPSANDNERPEERSSVAKLEARLKYLEGELAGGHGDLVEGIANGMIPVVVPADPRDPDWLRKRTTRKA